MLRLPVCTAIAIAVLAAACPGFPGASGNLSAQEIWRTLPQPDATSFPDSDGEVDIGAFHIYYEVHGTGDPVILLHGGLGNANHWGSQVAALREKFQVILMDSRGHGRSSWDGRPFGYHDMAGDVLALMDHLEIDRASIVGWSDGANIGLDLAIQHPARLARLVAFAGNFSPAGLRSPPQGTTTMALYFKRAIAEFEQMSGRANELARFRQALSRMWKSEPRFTARQLGAIALPVAVLHAEHDEIVREGHSRQLADLIPGAELKVLANVSHFAMWQDPEAFNAAVVAFLTGK